MEKLSLLLLRTLSEHDGFMTSKAAAAELGVSRKTVRRYAEEINQHQERYGCMIQAKKGSGLYLQITNEEAFQRRKEQASHNDDFVSRIIEFFIQEETYIKSEMLCERLFISQSKLSQELKKLRRILSHYQLSIQTKPYYGMKLSGSEFDLRRFMASNYLQRTHIKQLEEGTISEDTPSLLHQQIKAIVSSEFS
ncbi:lichenan operon transcriptional antiterminator [Enterococcus sp. AZ094]